MYLLQRNTERNRTIPIYQFDYKGVQLGFFNTILGGAGSAALLEEIIA